MLVAGLQWLVLLSLPQAGQSAAIKPAVQQLAAAGYKVAFLSGVVNGSPSGCGGHPGPTVHHAAFEALQPQIAALMGW